MITKAQLQELTEQHINSAREEDYQKIEEHLDFMLKQTSKHLARHLEFKMHCIVSHDCRVLSTKEATDYVEKLLTNSELDFTIVTAKEAFGITDNMNYQQQAERIADNIYIADEGLSISDISNKFDIADYLKDQDTTVSINW